MSLKGVFTFQVFFPFVLFFIGEYICQGHLTNSTSCTIFSWIFCITVSLNVLKRFRIDANKTIVFLALAITIYVASYTISNTDNQRSFLYIFPNIVLCVLWIQFWTFLDNSCINFKVYLKRKRNKLSRISIQLLLWVYIFLNFLFFGYGIAILHTMYSGSIISSLLSFYITTSPVLQTDAHQTQSPGFIRSSYGFDRKFPICNRSIQRFIGEDVKIQCKWQSEFVHETKWTLNGMEIKQSERTKTIATRDNNNVDTVEIFLIDKNDYGTYQLWISGNSTGNGVNKDSKVLFKDMIALMVLTEKDEIVNYLNVPVGNGLILDYKINFYFKTKVLDWNYKIERKHNEETTLEKSGNRIFNGCSLFSYILFETAYAIIGRNYVINIPELKSKSNTNIHVEVILCTTALTYGNHSLFVTREYYNETIQKKQTVTTRLRLKYIVLPDESYNIYGKGNNGTQPNPFENSEKSYLEEEIISCSFRQIIEVSLFALSFIFIWKHLIFFLHRNVISTTIRFIFSLGASTEKECPSNAYDYEYDVLIVSTENDKDFVTENTIITSLEDKEYTVCFPERDFDPGIPFLDSYSEVLRSSNTILVLFSEEFLEDPITYAIIYEILTMPSIKFRTDNILLIKIDECEIPSLLKKRCDLFDKTQLFPLESCRIELCIWLEARIPRFDRNAIRVCLAKLVFNAFLEMVFYYIVIVILIMYGCLPGSIFESYVGYCFCFAFVLQFFTLVRFIYKYISRNDEEKRIQNNM